ncbi:unannotated protein [freshwater metagenome]|uniref:Unannotated protein n=1 Tax=freshwater metagenome TaxID=449393 RepID=A0A6J6R5T4_9ZZZZ
MLTLITEILCDGGCVGCTLQSEEWGGVCRCCHDYRSCESFLAQDLFNELLDLSTTLSDQSHHDHVCAGVSSHHPEQDALADPAPCKQTHPLTTSNTEQCIDGTYPDIEARADRFSLKWVVGSTLEGCCMIGHDRPQTVKRLSGPIEYSPQ